MPNQLSERLNLFSKADSLAQLGKLQRGIEKESLRIDQQGKLAQSRHPHGLGSALTHPYITTDFSEALLELITPVSTNIEENLDCLDNIHRYIYSQLQQERLWASSMPCVLNGEENIPLAQYGTSNIATMKTAYRRGLGYRYGRCMQTIAGIHYNFSLPDELWQQLQKLDCDTRPLRNYITDNYFNMIRNFKRYSWLLVYLFGASPAVCKSFLNGREHQLEEFDYGSYYLPYATALRMGDLGYQSSAQQDLNICYNNIDNYIDTLHKAITIPHLDYQAIGLEVDGKYRQLSTALLQIENEFYSTIRPKRVTDSGETPIGALQSRGIEYIEVRCLDVNPFLPLGIDAEQIRFIDCFLMYCLLQHSPLCDDADRERIDSNQKKVVNEGRKPNLQLTSSKGNISLADWGGQLLDDIESIARLMDSAHEGDSYLQSCQQQRAKLMDASLTPSGKIIDKMQNESLAFFELEMQLSKQHQQQFLNRPLGAEQQAYFQQRSEDSFQRQTEIEEADTDTFETFLADYYQQYRELS